MGLFDIFKKKDPYEEKLKKMPLSMREVFKVLFPSGTKDFVRQSNELFLHFNRRISKDDIEKNLIFILTGYLITGDSKTKESAVNSVMQRHNCPFTKEAAEYMHDYAILNHPKLSALVAIKQIETEMSMDGCDTDTMPGGHGSFGLSKDNPIPAQGVTGIYDYLSRLYDATCNQVKFTRLGTTNCNVSNHPIDAFQIKSSKGVEILYMSAYQKRTSQLSPSGYILVDNNKVILSTEGTGLSVGIICTPESNLLPKLAGIHSFGIFSNEEISNMPQSFKEAESFNKKGIISANNGETDKALLEFDKAISLGSLNAINNKFTVLHCADRYHTALEHLEGIVDTPNATVLGLYNLAVLYYNGELDTHYKLKKDIAHSYTLLLKANHLTDDNKEERKAKSLELVNKLILRLESEDSSLLKIKDTIGPISVYKDNIKEKNGKINSTASNDVHFQEASPTTDIYGGLLLERLSDIYYCIHAGAEEMVCQMINLPEVSKEGMMEIEILMAAILSNNIKISIVLQALLSGNPLFENLKLAKIIEAMESYLSQYKSQVLHNDIKERNSLLDFAKVHGKLKLIDFKNTNTGKITKYPLFVDANFKMIKCRFVCFEENEKTANFIVKNKNNIIVDETKDGEHLFRLKRDIDYDYNFFMKIIAYYVYYSPLKYEYFLDSEEIDKRLANIKKKTSNVIILSEVNDIRRAAFEETSEISPDISYAFDQGIYMLKGIAASEGLI